MQKEEIKELIVRYHAGKCTDEEIAFLENWYNQWNMELSLGLTDLELGADLLVIKQNVLLPETKKFQLWPRVAVVAAAILVITLGAWLYISQQSATDKNDLLISAANIAPGKNIATLTLADGKTIVLSGAKNGIIVGDGKLTYNDGTALDSLSLGREMSKGQSEAHIQTITTPRGGSYQITLSDGTKVWLNAASSLSYTSGVNKKGERKVKLEGEGYFEVAKDKKHPFIVESRGQNVEVLGTHFNISTYADDGIIKTTLLEGSVKVNEVVLNPSQQSLLTGNKIKVIDVDAENEIAWKNGEFIFNDEPLGSIMKKVARWYDVEIEYEDPDIRKKQFAGTITRFGNVSHLLKKLSLTEDVHFKIEGRRIIVTK